MKIKKIKNSCGRSKNEKSLFTDEKEKNTHQMIQIFPCLEKKEHREQ